MPPPVEIPGDVSMPISEVEEAVHLLASILKGRDLAIKMWIQLCLGRSNKAGDQTRIIRGLTTSFVARLLGCSMWRAGDIRKRVVKQMGGCKVSDGMYSFLPGEVPPEAGGESKPLIDEPLQIIAGEAGGECAGYATEPRPGSTEGSHAIGIDEIQEIPDDIWGLLGAQNNRNVSPKTCRDLKPHLQKP